MGNQWSLPYRWHLKICWTRWNHSEWVHNCLVSLSAPLRHYRPQKGPQDGAPDNWVRRKGWKKGKRKRGRGKGVEDGEEGGGRISNRGREEREAISLTYSGCPSSSCITTQCLLKSTGIGTGYPRSWRAWQEREAGGRAGGGRAGGKIRPVIIMGIPPLLHVSPSCMQTPS